MFPVKVYVFPSRRIGADGGSMVPSSLIITLRRVADVAALVKKTAEIHNIANKAKTKKPFRFVLIQSPCPRFQNELGSSQLRDLNTVFPATLKFKHSSSGHISTQRRHKMQLDVVTSPPLNS